MRRARLQHEKFFALTSAIKVSRCSPDLCSCSSRICDRTRSASNLSFKLINAIGELHVFPFQHLSSCGKLSGSFVGSFTDGASRVLLEGKYARVRKDARVWNPLKFPFSCASILTCREKARTADRVAPSSGATRYPMRLHSPDLQEKFGSHFEGKAGEIGVHFRVASQEGKRWIKAMWFEVGT